MVPMSVFPEVLYFFCIKEVKLTSGFFFSFWIFYSWATLHFFEKIVQGCQFWKTCFSRISRKLFKNIKILWKIPRSTFYYLFRNIFTFLGYCLWAEIWRPKVHILAYWLLFSLKKCLWGPILGKFLHFKNKECIPGSLN